MTGIDIYEKVLVVSPAVEIDAHSAERLRFAVDAAFEKSPCINMIFDFAKVGFMDSSGIGMLIGRYKQTEKRGGGLALVNMNNEMTRLYTISGLAKIIKNLPSLDEAIAALRGGAQ
ncbi:MAG: anti-sigma factor antagonist [Defluviitaleaceae bacterium]|nr:anti-sigma factor antagonist [Defluviitaleaceae bacterium]